MFGGQGHARPQLPGPVRPDFSQAGYPSMKPDDIYPDPRPYFKPGSHYGTRPVDPDKPDSIRPHRPGAGYGIYPGGLGGSLYREYKQLKIL